LRRSNLSFVLQLKRQNSGFAALSSLHFNLVRTNFCRLLDNNHLVCYRSAETRKYSFPFSCCSRHTERPCISVDVNNENAHFQYSPNTDITVYRVGCGLGVTRRLREVVFANLRLYGWIVFALEASNAA